MGYRWSRPRYYGNRYATLCCIEVSKDYGTYIKSFTTYAGQLQLPYQDNGSLIGVGTKPRILRGAVWYHRPTSPYDEPDTQSRAEYNMRDCCVAPNTYPNYLTEDFWTQLNFEFDPPSDLSILNTTTCYCGFFSPYDSDNATSNFCHPVDDSKTDIYNMATAMTSTSARGLIIKAGTLNPVPPITEPKISITGGANTICRYNNNAATISWSNSPGSNSNTYLDINGHRVNQNSGDNAGSFTFTPSTYGVGQSSSYIVKVYRNNAYNGSTTVSDSCTMYTYTNPTLSNLTKNKTPINADQTETFNWNTNEPRWKSKNLERHVQKMTIDGNNVTEVSNNSEGDIKTITLTNIGRYVPFDPSQINGQTANVIVTKTHKNDSAVPSISTSTTFVVRRIPTQTVYKDNTSAPTSFKYYLITKDSSDSRNNREIPENYAVDRTTSKYIKVPIIYPSNTSSEDYGILHGYKVVVRFENGSTWEYDLNNDNKPSSTSSLYNTFINIPTDEMIYSLTSTLEITPYYKHSKTNYNTTYNNQKYYGPTESRRFPSVITRLPAPNILYPTENSTWINKNFRVLLQLPADADFDNYGAVVASDYIYRDVEMQVKANGTTRTYTWGEDSAPKQREIFSLNKLSYQKKLALNPSLRSDYQSATTYEIRMRVRKKYGYPDAQADESWSEYSAWRKVNVSTISFSVNEGDLIMATHQNKVYDFINRMKTCYKDTQKPMKTKKRNRGDYILASDYDVSYQDILDVYNLVNTWETKTGDFAKPAVKFKNGVALTEFSSTVGEYVTDLAHDTSPVGRNYITIMHDIANELK